MVSALGPFASQARRDTLVPRRVLEVRGGVMAEILRQVGSLPFVSVPAGGGSASQPRPRPDLGTLPPKSLCPLGLQEQKTTDGAA